MHATATEFDYPDMNMKMAELSWHLKISSRYSISMAAHMKTSKP